MTDWWKVSEEEADSPDLDPAKKILDQAFTFWIGPELDRRKNAGLLSEDFQLHIAQRIQRPDGKIEVRINDEAQGRAFMKLGRDVDKGDAIYYSDFGGLQKFDLIEEELDCGHWTVMTDGRQWFTFFNFLNNRASCAALLMKAEQFLNISRYAVEQNFASPAVDSLFSACELISKAELVSSHWLELKSANHKGIGKQLNKWKQLGNIEAEFVKLYNRLSELRPRYRYDAQQPGDMPAKISDIDMVEAKLAYVNSKLAIDFQRPDSPSD